MRDTLSLSSTFLALAATALAVLGGCSCDARRACISDADCHATELCLVTIDGGHCVPPFPAEDDDASPAGFAPNVVTVTEEQGPSLEPPHHAPVPRVHLAPTLHFVDVSAVGGPFSLTALSAVSTVKE
jgi:hypothetical protein